MERNVKKEVQHTDKRLARESVIVSVVMWSILIGFGYMMKLHFEHKERVLASPASGVCHLGEEELFRGVVKNFQAIDPPILPFLGRPAGWTFTDVTGKQRRIIGHCEFRRILTRP